MKDRTKVRCGFCGWRGERKRPFARPCPKCHGPWIVEHAVTGAYLLCFRNADGTKARFGHAGHYLGWSGDMARRIEHHRNGTGSNLMRHVRNAGIGFVVSRVWPGADRNRERRLHNRGGASRICPLCLEEKKLVSDESTVLSLHSHETRRETA